MHTRSHCACLVADTSTQGAFSPGDPPGLERQKMQPWSLKAARCMWCTHRHKPPWKPTKAHPLTKCFLRTRWTLRLRKIKELTQSHTAREWNGTQTLTETTTPLPLPLQPCLVSGLPSSEVPRWLRLICLLRPPAAPLPRGPEAQGLYPALLPFTHWPSSCWYPLCARHWLG